MAMEMHVFSDRRLNSMAEWQRALDLETYPVQFVSGIRFESARGLVPATLNGQQTGFEFYHDAAAEMIDHYGRDNFPNRWAYALGFRWRGDLAEFQAAWMAATAYARATGGVIFDPQAGRSYSAAEAADVVKDIERSLPAVEAAIRETVEKMTTGRSTQ